MVVFRWAPPVYEHVSVRQLIFLLFQAIWNIFGFWYFLPNFFHPPPFLGGAGEFLEILNGFKLEKILPVIADICQLEENAGSFPFWDQI